MQSPGSKTLADVANALRTLRTPRNAKNRLFLEQKGTFNHDPIRERNLAKRPAWKDRRVDRYWFRHPTEIRCTAPQTRKQHGRALSQVASRRRRTPDGRNGVGAMGVLAKNR